VRAEEDVKFHPPKGWVVTKLPDGTANVQAPGVPPGKVCAFVVLPDTEGEFSQHFNSMWKRITSQGVTTITHGERDATPGGLRMRSTTAAIQTAGRPTTHVHLFMMQSRGRLRTVIFACNDESLFERYEFDVRNMCTFSYGVAAVTAVEESTTTRPTKER
jgi:hypothetical protein